MRATRGPTRPQRDGSAPPPSSLLDQNPVAAIVALGAPTTGVMLVATASNVLHTYFVSRLGAESIAAVSLVFPISLIVITVMGAGVGSGVASAIARALGAGRTAEAESLAEHAFLIAAIAAAAFTLGLEAGAEPLFRAMGGRGEVLRQATLFARVLFAGLAVTFSCGTLDSILRGQGNVRVPALSATLSLGLQIVLTPLLMFTAGLGLIGAPLATLTGQLIGAIPRARYVFGGRSAIRPRPLPRTVGRAPVHDILRVGVPASVSALLNYIALIVLTGTFARFDDAHLAAYGLGTRLDFVLFSLGYGVAAATLTLVGMATGARRPDLVRRYVTRTIALAAAVVAVPALLVFWKPTLWLGIFTDEPEILAFGTRYFRTIGPTYLFVVASMVFASAFQALGRATIPLAVMTLRVVLVVTAAVALTRAMGSGAAAVLLVIAGGNVLSSLLLGFLFRGALARIAATHQMG